MKKLGLLFKETSEKLIKSNLKESESFFIINYAKVSGPGMNTLRQSLKNVRASLFMVKNSVARRALKDVKLDSLAESIEGPCGLVFLKDEPVSASRILCDFSRSHELLKLRGGFLEDRFLDKKDIEALSRLPSKEVLRAKAVMALKSPIFGIVMVLNQTLKKFVYCLEQVRQKKEIGGKNG